MFDAWVNFFIAQCGASAALLGLLFVSVSLNLGKILALPVLPDRALMAMLLLLVVLIVASLMLVPGQPAVAAGVEILGLGLLVCAVGAYTGINGVRHATPDLRQTFISHFVLLEAATLPYLVAGILLVAGNGAALYWLAAAIILSILKAVFDAWVLLVEINR